jgi:hypothetical protein
MDTVDQRIRKLAATLKSLGHDEESSDLLDWLETGDKLAQGWEGEARGDEKIYYWQSRGPVLSPLDHVPKANPREHGDGAVERIFEEVRKAKFPDRPSRLDCVYICENLEGFSGGSYCNHSAANSETYEVKLIGSYKIFKTNSEYWTEAVMDYFRYSNEEGVRSWAESYWEGDTSPTMGEVLVSPPEAAIIVGKYNND